MAQLLNGQVLIGPLYVFAWFRNGKMPIGHRCVVRLRKHEEMPIGIGVYSFCDSMTSADRSSVCISCATDT
jgi:hypothetical protein